MRQLGRDYFEDLYRDSPDPWGFERSGYEVEKYRHTLRTLGLRRFARGLELGCSIGVLTEMLAERCDELVALDISELAVDRARTRLSGVEGVQVLRLDAPTELPDGEFDLIVCSEVMYYWSEALLVEGLAKLESRLGPGGALLAVHWRPRTSSYPLQGERVHTLLRAHTTLTPIWSGVEPRYLIDLFERGRTLVESGASLP